MAVRVRESFRMSDIIYPRSPRETMCGWMHLPRFIDKIRLHLAGKLHADYQANFCKGFDKLWLDLAGVDAAQFIELVRNSITDGEVCDWVFKNVKKPESARVEQRERMLNYPRPGDTASGIVSDPVPVAASVVNFSPMPRIAPPPFGAATDGSKLSAAGELPLVAESGPRPSALIQAAR